jgi:hypothetical protein
MERHVTSRRFDIGRGEIGRVLKMYVLHRWLPLGNLGGFTRMRQLVILLLLHRLGAPLCRLLIPYEDRLTRLYNRLRRG